MKSLWYISLSNQVFLSTDSPSGFAVLLAAFVDVLSQTTECVCAYILNGQREIESTLAF